MALLPCPECGKKVSTDAVACIACGGPTPKIRKGEKLTTEEFKKLTRNQRNAFKKAGGKVVLTDTQKIFSFILFSVLIFGISKCNTNQTKASVAVSGSDQNINRLAYDAAQGALILRSSISQPKTFELMSVSMNRSTGDICYIFGSQNNLGQKRTNYGIMPKLGSASKIDNKSKIYKRKCLDTSLSDEIDLTDTTEYAMNDMIKLGGL
jgi:hypothetical protein